MDKVIIDGVDVSECEHYRAEIETKMPYGEYETQKDKCYYSGIEVIQDCKGVKGCIYKQLKRLEQENKQLKKSIDRIMQNKEIKTIDLDIAKENAELKVENDRLKEEITKLSDPRYQISKVNEGYYNRMNTYKQALQEIRDMATLFHSVNENKGLDRFKNNILDKINEVIGAEDET